MTGRTGCRRASHANANTCYARAIDTWSNPTVPTISLRYGPAALLSGTFR